MITGNNGNYGRDDRNFYHPEDDIRSNSDKNNGIANTYNPEDNESYVDEYQREKMEEQQVVNQNSDITNNPDNLDEQFSNSLERDDDDWNEDEDDLDDIDEDDINPDDIDDDLEEDYDENDREMDGFATDQLKRNEYDQEFDIDQDLEEVDPVNNPRKF
ncbi:hypothetical protein [Flavobacterium sp. 9]|uniref:hypothetical protein n=1 Tax=Flavobacterium sp. 9 TaxID=2035198 RepID=UPI000C189CF7|nr:hypothetical protein [Flavobacterium sp. 9]